MSEWFLARVTAALGGGRYTAAEVWADETGTIAEKVGGVPISSAAPGYAVDSSTLSVGQMVLARFAPGAAGTLFELAPVGSAVASAEAHLPVSVVLTGGEFAYQDTGLTLDLPAAGTYLLYYQVGAELTLTAPGVTGGASLLIGAQLYASAPGLAVARTQATVCSLPYGEQAVGCVGLTVGYTAGGAVTIGLEAFRALRAYSGSVINSAILTSTAVASTHLGYLKVG